MKTFLTKQFKSFSVLSALTINVVATVCIGCSGTPFSGSANTADKSNGNSDATEQPVTASSQVQPNSASAPNAAATPSAATTPNLSIPNTTPDELATLQKCLAAWPNNPFSGNVTNYKKVVQEWSIGSNGDAIDDRTSTPTPELILISTAANFGAAPIYQLLNPNGYYCFENNLNIGSTLVINLACTAQIASPGSQQNIGSTIYPGAQVATGTNIGSNVTLHKVNPSGGACP